MDETYLKTLAELAASLSTMMEIAYLPEDAEAILPEGVRSLREAQLILGKHNYRVPDQVTHWVRKLNAVRPN